MLPVWCRLWGLFLSTPSARRATECAFSGHRSGTISIHALREEGDLSASYYYTFSKISIHALREEGDECREHAGRNQCISIHALREEGDQRQPCIVAKLLYFYPRPPRGGRRVFLDEDQSDILISIHALREEGDRVRFLRSSQRHNFYPRPPRGGRRTVSTASRTG